MKVVVTGYTGTGSSAVIHLLKEYSKCSDFFDNNYEHVVLCNFRAESYMCTAF